MSCLGVSQQPVRSVAIRDPSMVATWLETVVRKTVDTQTEATHKRVEARRVQGNDLLSLVDELKEGMTRLRTIKECERDLDLWT